MEYVYHGSKMHDLKELEPHESTHGNYVYATKDKTIAIVMSKRCGDDATYTFGTPKDNVYDLVERIPFAFKKMFSNDFSLYTLDASNFKDIKTGFNEVVSENSVKVLKEEKYNNVYEAIHDLEKQGLIRIYIYPDRPDYIPQDDKDIVYKVRNVYIGALHRNVTDREFMRWIFLHPNLENEFRKLAK